MIRINLLPHRELKRKVRQQQFAVLAGIAFFLGLLTVGMVHLMITGQIEHQESRNKYMKNQIAILDKQIDEIKKIRAQTQALLARKKVVETLQDNRSDAVHLLDQLVRLLPDGVYLRSIKQTNQTINLAGYAQSNARVSTLMRKLESSPWLGSPSLIEIKAATVNNTRLNEFNLNVILTRSSQSDGDENSIPGIAKP